VIVRVEVVDGDQLAQRVAEILIDKLTKITKADAVANTDLGRSSKITEPDHVRSGLPDHPGGDGPAGSDVYAREPRPDHGAPHQRGVRHGGIVDGGELVDETTIP
jgi:hypothetical protein